MAKPQQVLQITTWARKGLTSKGMCEEVEGWIGEKSCSVWQIHVEYDDGASGLWEETLRCAFKCWTTDGNTGEELQEKRQKREALGTKM